MGESTLSVTDEELKRIYDANKDKYKIPDFMKIQKLVMSYTNENKQAVRSKVEQAKKLLKEGIKFQDVARMYNDSNDSGNNFELIYDAASSRSEDVSYLKLKAEAEKLAVGQFSDVLEMEHAFYMIQLVERKS